MKKYCVYIRVSTRKQGASGLGLESQHKICRDFIEKQGGELVAEFKDVESGTHRDRKGLRDAIAYCKAKSCALVLAKLDRLARDVEFCFSVINTGIEIHFCDMPQINTLLLGVFASVAQYERELTSDRTKKALAAKKARGELTGGASEAWMNAFASKTKDAIKEEYKEKGIVRNTRFLNKPDTKAFLKVLRNVFPNACAGDDAKQWDWTKITTKGDYKDIILSLMRQYKDIDNRLFSKWDFSADAYALQVRLCSNIQTIRKSVNYGS